MLGNKDLLVLTKEITVAALSGGAASGKHDPGAVATQIIQAVYDKLSELNGKQD